MHPTKFQSTRIKVGFLFIRSSLHYFFILKSASYNPFNQCFHFLSRQIMHQFLIWIRNRLEGKSSMTYLVHLNWMRLERFTEFNIFIASTMPTELLLTCLLNFIWFDKAILHFNKILCLDGILYIRMRNHVQ